MAGAEHYFGCSRRGRHCPCRIARPVPLVSLRRTSCAGTSALVPWSPCLGATSPGLCTWPPRTPVESRLSHLALRAVWSPSTRHAHLRTLRITLLRVRTHGVSSPSSILGTILGT